MVKYAYLILVFCLTSCIEIVEDLNLNTDGSGTFKYSVNLSSSKLKVRSILALDSYNGESIIKEPELKQKIQQARLQLIRSRGISKVSIVEDYDNYIVKLQFDFDDVENLELAIKSIFKTFYESEKYNLDWISYKNNTLSKNIPAIQSDYLSKFITEGADNGCYISITRFGSTVKSCSNELITKSKSGKAVMIKVPTEMLISDSKVLANIIVTNK